jgi:putrescine aminotransferase
MAAARLVGHLGGRLPRVYFGLNGADAVECAVKLARLATGRDRIVAIEGAFHGKSLGALALTHHERFRAGLRGVLPGVVHVPRDSVDAVSAELARGDVAAVVFEPVQGESGVRPLDCEVIRAWCAAAAGSGTFTIADEIQTGLRRCGEPSLVLAAGLPVDAVLLGKPLGGGVLPLSAAVCSERLFQPLIADPLVHSATFGAHPLACAAVPPALDAFDSLADRGATLAIAVRDGLERLRKSHPDLVVEVRGRGLLWGVELASPALGARLLTALGRAGLLVSPCLGSPATLRLMPPLVAGDRDVEEALTILDGALGALPADR